MKEHLRELVDEGRLRGIMPTSIAREYLQARMLGALQRSGAMMTIAFHGGTALRFLYRIPRFSEDLDFTLEGRPGELDLRHSLRTIRSELAREGYRVDLKLKTSSTVHAGLVGFPGLLFELGISPRANAVLKVKLEVDTRPPAGAGIETTMVRRYVPLRLCHHDRPSMLAGKLHAVLQRPWTKGRDLYDLMWYLSDPDWPEPNLVLLNNALQQTGWREDPVTSRTWRQVLRERVARLDWSRVVADVRPFLEPGSAVELFTLDALLSLI